MSLDNRAEQTYSFGSGEIAEILRELARLLKELGVDIRDRAQLKAGYERLFNIEWVNLPDLDSRGYILAPNHVSDFDALIVGTLHKNIKIMSKSDWVDSPQLMAFLSPAYSLIGIDRHSKVSQARALVEMIKHLSDTSQAHHALIFPQGTISNIGNNSIERIQPGAFTLSCRSGAPVLPVYIEQPNFTRPTRVVFGTPMAIPDRKEDCRAQWMEAVVALQNSLQPPARTPVLTEKHANNNKPGDPFF